MLEELTLAAGPMERPVAMFVSAAAGDLAQAAVEAGLSAHVVGGMQLDRLKPVLDTAIARFQVVRQTRHELAKPNARSKNAKRSTGPKVF